jgi:hypothetical protein
MKSVNCEITPTEKPRLPDPTKHNSRRENSRESANPWRVAGLSHLLVPRAGGGGRHRIPFTSLNRLLHNRIELK